MLELEVFGVRIWIRMDVRKEIIREPEHILWQGKVVWGDAFISQIVLASFLFLLQIHYTHLQPAPCPRRLTCTLTSSSALWLPVGFGYGEPWQNIGEREKSRVRVFSLPAPSLQCHFELAAPLNLRSQFFF